MDEVYPDVLPLGSLTEPACFHAGHNAEGKPTF
jgi:hypothetical protein